MKWPRHISSSRAYNDKISTATPVFRVKLSSGSTSDFVGHRCVLEIQGDSQITGSTNNCAGFTDTHRSKNNTGVYDCVRNIEISSNHGRRYLVSKIQDGNQLTGSSNISETMTHIIKIPTANLRHSTMSNSQEVYLGDSDNNRQSEIASETGNTYISETI